MKERERLGDNTIWGALCFCSFLDTFGLNRWEINLTKFSILSFKASLAMVKK